MENVPVATMHQLVHTLSYGDAISGEVLAFQRCARAQGRASEIFAINVHPRYKGMAYDYRDFPVGFDDEVVLHYSLGSPLNELYVELNEATRSLVYHNITPAKWFTSVNPRIVRDIERGLEELPKLCALSDRLIADSKFNAQELSEIGFTASVLELPIDPARWDGESNQPFGALVRAQPGLHLLHVGRLAPNKCIEDIIKMFHFVHYHVEPQSFLWLAGIDIDTELYSFQLKRMARELEVDEHVRFTGALADSEISALYQNCSVYVCMSEHEGFCLPVVEAMHFGLPVMAYASSAVTDTVGAGGIVFREKRFPELAEVVGEVYRNGALRAQLIEAGRARVKELSYERFCQSVGTLFSSSQPRAVLRSAGSGC